MHAKRHPIRLAYRAGCDADGRLTALHVRGIGDSGAYASVGMKVLERAAVADLDLDAEVEARTLIAAAARRELRQRSRTADRAVIEEDTPARLDLHQLAGTDGAAARTAAESLLAWLHRRTEERTAGGS